MDIEHNENREIGKFETTIFKLSIMDNKDAYMLIIWTITVAGEGDATNN